MMCGSTFENATNERRTLNKSEVIELTNKFFKEKKELMLKSSNIESVMDITLLDSIAKLDIVSSMTSIELNCWNLVRENLHKLPARGNFESLKKEIINDSRLPQLNKYALVSMICTAEKSFVFWYSNNNIAKTGIMLKSIAATQDTEAVVVADAINMFYWTSGSGGNAAIGATAAVVASAGAAGLFG